MSLLSYFEALQEEDTQKPNIRKTKKCSKCFVEKDIIEFHKASRNKDGCDSRCRSCKSYIESVVRKLKKTAPPKPGVCDNCSKPNKLLVLDHDHKTDLFRGWLCFHCNMDIGRIGDNIESLQRAIDYLERSAKKEAERILNGRHF